MTSLNLAGSALLQELADGTPTGPEGAHRRDGAGGQDLTRDALRALGRVNSKVRRSLLAGTRATDLTQAGE